MKFVEGRPYADPQAAARKLMEIANSVEPVRNRYVQNLTLFLELAADLFRDLTICIRSRDKAKTRAASARCVLKHLLFAVGISACRNRATAIVLCDAGRDTIHI